MADKDTISIFFACDDNYAKHAAVAIASICENSKRDFRFFMLNRGLSDKSEKGIADAAGQNCVEFTKIAPARFDKFNVALTLKYLSAEACFRYLIPSIALQLDKALYLDCDVIAFGDLGELYDTDISEHYAAVVESAATKQNVEKLGPKRYFNSGVVLMNLTKIRRDGLEQKFFEKSHELNGKSICLDQDVWNVVMQNSLKYVPPKWNVPSPLFKKEIPMGYPADEMKEAVESPKIIQFTGSDKPWVAPFGPTAHPYAPTYFKYLRGTEFRDSENEMKSSFKPIRCFLRHLRRHPVFLFKRKFRMSRAIYRRNLSD